MKYLALCLLAFVLSIHAVAQEDKPLSDETEALIEKAEGGDAEAQFNLGVAYDNGEGVREDHKEAVKWYRKAADQGFADAQYYLGKMYYRGTGVLKDYKEMMKWYRKAADQGFEPAQIELGEICCIRAPMWNLHRIWPSLYPPYCSCFAPIVYRLGYTRTSLTAVIYRRTSGTVIPSGESVLKDYKEAVKWWSKAADQGNSRAQFLLGWMYASGTGVLKDYVTAYAWWSLGEFNGDEGGNERRDKIAEKMTPEQIAEAQELSKELLKQIEENKKDAK